MYNILKYVWLKWLYLLNKIFNIEIVQDMDEINKIYYYLLKYLGLPFILWFAYKMILFEIIIYIFNKK